MDAYKIGIAILLTDGFTAVLSKLSHQLVGIHGSVKDVEKGIGRWGLAIGGVGAVLAGSAILGGMAKLVDKTKEYSDELVKLERLGGGIAAAAASGDIGRRAFDIAQRVPMKVVDLMKIPGATYSIIGEEESMKLWEPLARFSWVMQSQKGYDGDPGSDVQKLLRAGELSGRLTDPVTHRVSVAQTEKFLDLAARVVAATHGMVNPDTLLGMAKQGGFTLRGLSDQGFYTQAIMAQAMGGPRAGTAFLSMWQQMAAGTMFTRTAEGMQELGLLHPGEWHKSGGRVILSDEASKRLTALIGKDPLEFAANVIGKLKDKGITDPQDQMRMVMRIMNRQTTQRYTAEMVTNFMQMVAERERLMGGLGSEGSFSLLNNKSVSANITALGNAWSNLQMAIAGPNSENTITILKALTRGIDYLTQAIQHTDPKVIRMIALGIAALGAVLITAGIGALIAAIGLGGWIAVGLVALAAAAAVLFQKWPAIKQFASELYSGVVGKLEGALSAIRSKFDAFVAWLGSIPSRIIGFLGGSPGGPKYDPGKPYPDPFANPGVAPPGGAPKLEKQSWVMPRGGAGRPITLTTAINLDGRALADVLSQRLADDGEFSTQAPYQDGMLRRASIDSQTTTT